MNRLVKFFFIIVKVLLLLQISGCATNQNFDNLVLSKTETSNKANILLREIQWQLLGYRYQGEWISNFETERVVLVFNRGKYLNGFSGCNVFSAEYKLSDKNISISDVLITRKQCQSRSDIIMYTEREILSVMQEISTYDVDYKTLILFNENGKRILVFKRKSQ